ncbi:C25 family cysteine peptidase [Paracrocinitomix mangrovi]|uniref:putative type IX secretion system sortase PorU2 n=1 Tax=Paracrocinitomix mangrovi TaxID=2862509 RepID=UPI001C8EA010|nr:C25 family cysteine peptidase [Paracrocinitomix mangrovi]UKN01536.1 C25 family cysteine peptidase [Paracrocinitomix mangrovi]
MKKIVAILSFLISGLAFGQYPNDWIDYSQKYFTFKVWQDGVYKLDYATLSAAGVPVSTISPDNYQLFGFEQEQPIYIQGGGDGSFDPGDYILFYGKKNNTWMDSLMYDDASYIANKYYPHYNDTINYFLSWNTSTNNVRYQQETDVNYTAYTPYPYFLKRTFNEHHNRYLEGWKVQGMSYSRYTTAEGWFSNAFNAVTGTSYLDDYIATPNPYTGAGAPLVIGESVSASSNNASHDGSGNHHLSVQFTTSNIQLLDTIYSGYQTTKLDFTFPASNLGSSTTKIRHQGVNDLGVASDYQSVAYVELIYPHTTNLGNGNYMEMIVPNHLTEAKTRLDLTSFSATEPMALTFNNGAKLLPVTDNSGTFQVLVPNNSQGDSTEMVIFDAATLSSISSLQAINGTGYFQDLSSLNFEEAYIIVTGDKLWSSANDYKTYRSSALGGSHNVLLLNERELWMQFGGGVGKHPFGVRRFVQYAYESATNKPTHLFLLGKGIREGNESVASPAGVRQSAVAYEGSIVPCYGYPASDVFLTSHLSNNGFEPLIPTGRLAAKSNQEVSVYIGKVIEFEAEQDSNSVYNMNEKLWQKQILHFGGGSNVQEQTQFKHYLNIYEGYLEGQYFGGNVTSFYKTVSDPIDPVTLFEVTDYINQGVSIMTFFGHASADGFDQNVDDPNNWDNKGKYPLVVGNACLTGNIFEPTALSTSEKYVLIPDRGAIAFLSNVKQAYSNSLHDYSNNLFYEIANPQYGESIGQCTQTTVDIMDNGVLGFGKENVMLQMTLHGDPALRINPHNRPELEVNNTSIFVTPEAVDLSVDSIDVNVIIYNLGKSATDTFAVELTRTFPNNGGDSLYTKLVDGIDYIDTVVFTIPLYNNVGIGLNEFAVAVDIPSLVDEQYDEVGNNQISKQVIFDVDGIYPVWPYEFAVVPKDTVTLKGSTVNPFAAIGSYRFEVDTTDEFNSPEHRYAEITSMGGIIEVEYDQWLNVGSDMPDELILQDSMVYFWRVTSIDTAYYWIESSFQHIPNKTGWGQDHFFQFKNNDFLFLDYDRPSRKRLFGPAFRLIDCDVYGQATSWLETAFTLYHIDGEIAEYNFCTITPQLLVSVIDPTTLEPWGTLWNNGTTTYNPGHNFGNHNNDGGCRDRVEYHFSYWQTSPAEMDAFDNLINNVVPDGYYILIYTARYADFSEWDSQNFATFNSLGVDSTELVNNGDSPFILFTKKGNTLGNDYAVVNGGTNFVLGDTINSDISQVDTLWGFDYFGTETSPIIGPANDWSTLYWRLDSMETPTEDSTRLILTGITWGGSKTVLMDSLVPPYDSIVNLNTMVDPAVYPYIQLSAHKWDKTGFTPAQLDRWHVLYEDVPEAALDGSAGIYWIPGDSLHEGQDLAVAFDIDNISDLDMDSLLINYWIEDAGHNLIPIPYPRQDSLRVGGTIRDTISLSSLGLIGLNSFWVEANPYINNNQTDQIEKYHFNNVGQIPFNVLADDENPILDVTFNGYHILNGDIVDPYAEVIITLKDDNEYLIMDQESDTANFNIFLTDPNGVQKRLDFRNSLGEPLMEWIPADAASRKFKIIHQGNFEDNGTYRLLVQGVDKSGNISGDLDYNIEFEVDHNSSITNLMNYPNPFTTSTQFVFTLTGSVIPDEFTIQIMNVTGTVVREITRDELGDIQIGRNITEFAWDGTDEFGDQLARGVYLYRVIVKINGEEVDHRESGADEYFTKSFGKMYKL